MEVPVDANPDHPGPRNFKLGAPALRLKMHTPARILEAESVQSEATIKYGSPINLHVSKQNRSEEAAVDYNFIGTIRNLSYVERGTHTLSGLGGTSSPLIRRAGTPPYRSRARVRPGQAAHVVRITPASAGSTATGTLS